MVRFLEKEKLISRSTSVRFQASSHIWFVFGLSLVLFLLRFMVGLSLGLVSASFRLRFGFFFVEKKTERDGDIFFVLEAGTHKNRNLSRIETKT